MNISTFKPSHLRFVNIFLNCMSLLQQLAVVYMKNEKYFAG
ncbi:hypothetical protein CODIS_40930 [Candidatus Thiodiazotropha endolucinida]|uniref:Uncharacterized protein n=1 Tax=Candidatus Thiodiazotropha endolucinida TaxID=1655433 RepID=A0A7Z0VHM4_9GAMM|nr:hypothetical protein CODIS_40930 [Candidatus Thiodiazotropha endolucinida]